MTGKLYIAGASADIERAERWIAKAREAGVHVTEDWPAKVRTAGAANVGTIEQLRAAAEACERGVIAASVVWVLVPRETRPTAGAWYEMGMARALGARIVVSADWIALQRCVFTYSDGVERFLTDESAFARVVELCRGGQ